MRLRIVVVSRFAAFIIFSLVMLGISHVHAIVPDNSILKDTDGPVAAAFEFLEDPTSTLSIEQIRSEDNKRWQTSDAGSASFGFSHSTYWLKLSIKNQQSITQNTIVEVAYPLLDEVSFFAFAKNNAVRELHTGDQNSFYPRDVDHPNMLFRHQLAPGESILLYIRAKTEGSMILPVNIWRENQFFEFAAKAQKAHFFYYGLLSVIVLINLSVFASLRERIYLFYALSTLGYLTFFLTSRGYGQQLLFPDSPTISSQLFLSSMPFLALFSLLFARAFLRTFQHSPIMDRALLAMIYFEYFNMVAAIVFSYNTAVKISAVSAIVLFMVLFAAGPVTWAKKRRAGIFFTIAWIPLTLGVATTAGRTSGYLPNNFFTEYAMQIGSGLEAFILMLALADRLYHEREQKLRARAKNLETEKHRLEAESQLADAMLRDPITQLPNRNRFEWMVNNTFRNDPDDRFILGVARIRRMNEITRTLGLTSSEKIIHKVAQQMNLEAVKLNGVVCLESSHGKKDAAFHLSGDTFGVLIRQKISKKFESDYLSILQKLTTPIIEENLSIELSPQFGSALYPAHGKDAAQLIRNAYVAMEHASSRGTELFTIYDPSLDIYNESRLTLMADLRQSIKDSALTINYQPKIDLKSEIIIGLEALIRWEHPERGFVSPADFIPLAEETGVINQLTRWVVNKAVEDLVELKQNGYTGSVAINISAMDLLDPDFTDYVTEILTQYGVSPSSIFFELTETAAMLDPVRGMEVLDNISTTGIKISIDDFGTGHSSLSYLKQLPASEIKLDRSLIKDICDSESSRVIVKTSIDMAHSLGYEIVAEGAEDKETYDLLKTLNCDKLQGFWLCRPLPLDSLIEWLSTFSLPQK